MDVSSSYVFKLHYDDGPSHVSRRYGYTGKIASPAVFSGLYDRTAQVLSIHPGTFTLAIRDSLGNPSIKLDSYPDFVSHVCQPLLNSPHIVKIDEKGRKVLVFIVEKKGIKKEQTETEKPLATSFSNTESTTGESLVDYSPLSTGGKNGIDQISRRFEGKSGIDDISKRFEPARPAISKPGYHAAYSTSSTASSSTSGGGAAASNQKEQEEAKPVIAKLDKKETWGSVRNMLETFVKDLNVHLADTFGDEAGSFRLNAGESKKESAPVFVSPPRANPVEPKVVHKHVFCDRCLKTISGSRFKCRSCSNYDLCESCVDFRTQFHPGAHAFSEIVRPGSAALPSLRGAVEVERQPTPRVVTPASTIVPARPSPPAPVARPLVHNATCDICQKTITGTRMKCTDCPDWDCCETCYSSSSTTSEVHPGHNFVSIHHPRDLKWHPRINSTPVHHHVRCDGCQTSPIRGARFKCTHSNCPDFDLCQNCEADPIPRHPLDHHLLKIRQPMKTFFGIPAEGGGGGFAVSVRRAREFTGEGEGGGAQGPTATPATTTHSNPIANLISTIGAAVQTHTSSLTSPPVPSTEKAVSTEKTQTSTVGTQVGGDEEMKEVEKPKEVNQVKIESESESSEDEKEEEEEQAMKVDARKNEEKRLGCSYVADITLQDGSIVPAGSEFCKVWKVRNSGTIAWKNVRLVNVGGFEANNSSKRGFNVADLGVGEETEVQCECKAPEEDGRFMSFFTLEDEEGNKFGDRFWLDITVESDGTLRNSASLTSSSIITPSLNAGGKAASIPATVASTSTSTATSIAPSTTFSLSEAESDFESIRGEPRPFVQDNSATIDTDEEDDEDYVPSEESSDSSELESSDEDDEFVMLSSDEGDVWKR
ncbi:uncharacterized protein JCM6883_005477 [Sporobolomyces salmoneus]|uniref:uncharacterized protein n=1 Tax=Sporobolomyces salmoneus TaxID=183962 RepID=UPI0031824DBC